MLHRLWDVDGRTVFKTLCVIGGQSGIQGGIQGDQVRVMGFPVVLVF